MTTADFNSMITENSKFLKPYAASLTRDSDDANDLCQETMLKALLNRNKYTTGTNIKGWLYTIMRNIFINGYRRNQKFTKVQTDTPETVIMHHTDYATGNMGWSNIRMSEIDTAMNQLPPVFKQCFELHYQGYKYQEIAEQLNEPIGTIKSRIHFARKELKAKLVR